MPEAYIVDAVRTPVGRRRGALSTAHPADMGAHVIKAQGLPGVPKGISALRKQPKKIIKLLRTLGLGLLVIDPDAALGNVDVLCDPGEYKPRQAKQRRHRLLGEFMHRVGDPNAGGSTMRRGIMTAYRQKAIAIADYLQEHGETKAAVIAQSLAEPKTRAILYNNVYGWFDRLGKGVYALSPQGKTEFPKWLTHDQTTD